MRSLFALLCCMLVARTLAMHTPRSKCMESVHHTLGDLNKSIMKNYCHLEMVFNVTSVHYNYVMPDGGTGDSLHCFGDCPYWEYNKKDGFFKKPDESDYLAKIAFLEEENAYLTEQVDKLQKERLYASEDYFNQENAELNQKVLDLTQALQFMMDSRDRAESIVVSLLKEIEMAEDMKKNIESVMAQLEKSATINYDEEEEAPVMHILPVGDPIVDEAPENDEEDPEMHILPVDVDPIIVNIDDIVQEPVKIAEPVQELVSNIQVLEEVSVEEVNSMMSH